MVTARAVSSQLPHEEISRRPLRIIQVFNRYLEPGGEEKSVARIALDLESAGHHVIRFWRESKEWNSPSAPSKWRQPFLLFNNAQVLGELRELHAKENADIWILHNLLPVISLGVYRLAGELNVPLFRWLHNYRPISPSGTLMAGGKKLQPDDPFLALKETLHGSWRGIFLTGWLALAYKILKRRGDFSSVSAWIAISDEMTKIFQQAGWPSERLFTLRHSWHIQPAPETDFDGGYFLFLGRMVDSKGVRFLIDLWKNPALENHTLVMAGQGPLVNELRHESPPNVRWVGHVSGESKRELIAGCRAVLFPSAWHEPLGIVAYEAYQMRKPVLASDLGGMKETVQTGETGYLLPPDNSLAWIDVITNLDENKARRLGRNGRDWLEKNVSTEVWCRQFDEIAQSVLAQEVFRSL